MFNIGMPELILILIIALIVFGPGKLPEIGSAVGKAVREFRKATTQTIDVMFVELRPLTVKDQVKDIYQRLDIHSREALCALLKGRGERPEAPAVPLLE